MEEKDIKEKKQIDKKILIPIIGIIIAIIAVGISFAAWNWGFIGNANTISTANIELDLLESNTDIITIENALPISDNEGKAQEETFNFAVTSKTKQTTDIGYSIILEKLEVDSGYTSLEDRDIKLYLTDFNNTQLLEPVTINRIKDKVIYSSTHSHDSTHETIQDKFKLRAWIDENVDASDWNADTKLQYKFRIGVRENKEVHLHGLLYNIVADQAELDTNVDFSQAPSGHNKKYTFSSTKDDKYPVHYYRGEVDNNFVKFANLCWRAVRTTSTGGTKLIYSGVPEEKFEMISIPQSDYSNITNNDVWTFDTSDNSWNLSISSSGNKDLSFEVPEGKYSITVSSVYNQGGGSVSVYKNNDLITSTSTNLDYNLGDLQNDDTIQIKYSGGGGPAFTANIKIKMQMIGESLGEACPKFGTSTQLPAKSEFNLEYKSQAYNGYMYGTVYATRDQAATSGSLFGSSFTYSNGIYTLSNTTSAADNTHHYTCNNTTGTCSTIRYYYYISGSSNYYIELTNGKSVSDALEEMQTNTTDSTIKTSIDSWYRDNMTSYTNRIEDTPWCNDRSMQTTTNGWKENGNLSEILYYGANVRVGYSHDSITPTYRPSIDCPNKNDAFSVNIKNGNGALQYPVALLTADEITMAGSGSSGYSSSSYLNAGVSWWSLSPACFETPLRSFFLDSNHGVNWNHASAPTGVRPSISLKVGTIVKDGDGTYMNPMIVE